MPSGLFCFSGNGMSRQVAEGLLRAGVGSDDGSSLGFVFPVYGWRPPRILARFVREDLRARLADRPLKYVWAVMTCGFDVGYADFVFRSHAGYLHWTAGFSSQSTAAGGREDAHGTGSHCRRGRTDSGARACPRPEARHLSPHEDVFVREGVRPFPCERSVFPCHGGEMHEVRHVRRELSGGNDSTAGRRHGGLAP